jgi:sugar/nucleoside kinase (ribokinase family)
VIVVIGQVRARQSESGDLEPSGFVASVALSAAAEGARVEVVSRLGDDPAGDAVVLGFAQAGVGHVAMLRDGGARTAVDSTVAVADVDEPASGVDPAGRGPDLDAADVELALRYLSDYRVIVLAHPRGPDVVAESLAAAAWGPAHLVVVSAPDTDTTWPTSPDALVLSAAPDAEAIASRLGRYAAAVDSGDPLDTAYAVLTGANGES